MAKFTKSPFLPELRGKLGGSKVSKNRYGPNIGNNPQPVARQSDAQNKVIHNLINLSQIWSYKLSDEQYAAWTKYASKFKGSDSSGNTYTFAPRDVFTNHNSRLKEVGMPIILDPPKNTYLQDVGKFKFEIFSDNGEDDLLFYFKPALKKDTRLLIFATDGLRSSKFYFKDNWFRLIGYVDSSFKSGDSFISVYRSRFNYKFPPNFKIAFRVCVVSSVSGISSELEETSASFRTYL